VLVSRAETADEWAALARKVEDLGYSTLLIADHFGRQLAPLPALVAAASVTSRLRVGTFVLDNDFRHPATVAKVMDTIPPAGVDQATELAPGAATVHGVAVP